MDRYSSLFDRLGRENRGALVPFAILGYPSPERSLEWIEALLPHADALELGLPFSDPIADGPVIQTASHEALTAGARLDSGLAIVRQLRARHPELPIGLLVYANLVYQPGLDRFYEEIQTAGADSVLVPDVPSEEARPFVEAARSHGIAPILIAPPNATEATLARIAKLASGYTYVVSRSGVTGTEQQAGRPQARLFETLKSLGAPPGLVGFGISSPEDVGTALAQGAAGVIVGSSLIEKSRDPARLQSHLRSLAWATRRQPDEISARPVRK
jgi:tryptophan synthase alpha chain